MAIWNTANGKKLPVTIEKRFMMGGREWAKIWHDGLCFQILANNLA